MYNKEEGLSNKTVMLKNIQNFMKVYRADPVKKFWTVSI